LRGGGTAVAQWLRCCATNRKVAASIPTAVCGFLIDIKFFRSHYGPGVNSASNRNEYQEYFLGVKARRCVRLTTLPPPWANATQSGNLNFLEPSGPLRACNGTASSFYEAATSGSHLQESCCFSIIPLITVTEGRNCNKHVKLQEKGENHLDYLNFWRRNYFLILAHPVCKM